MSASTLAYQLKAPIILVSPGHKDSMILQNDGETTTTPSETFTVTEPSTTGFTVAVKPSLNGLNANDFILLDGFYDNCSVTICHIFSGDKVELDEKFPDI